MATEHSAAGLGKRHAPHNWEYADAAARTAATGFVAGDVGKWAKQLDTGVYYELTDDSPVTWAQRTGVGSGAVSSVNGQTGAVVLDADDISDSGTTNQFATAAELSKLAGIEALADVTGATNVAAAGALMVADLGVTVAAYDAEIAQIAALADPGADRLLFWDDSAGAYVFLAPGTGLTITGTTLDAAGGGGGGGGMAIPIGWISGRWYDLWSSITSFAATMTAFALAADNLFTVPFYVPAAGSIDRIGFRLAVASAAGGLMRLGIYEPASNGLPGALVVDGGTVAIDTGAGTDRTITVSQSLSAGWYYAAGIASLSCQVYGFVSQVALFGYPDLSASTTNRQMVQEARAFGALPATFTATPSFLNGGYYRFAVRAA